MTGEVLLSTAYFPPADYFSLIARNKKIRIERHENYIKQTYRNRCIILGANGPLDLIVPVLRGSFHKTAISDLRIDNNKPWRDLHLRGITSSYSSSPFYEFYFDIIKDVISRPFTFLLDLNNAALNAICETIELTAKITFSDSFIPAGSAEGDWRYSIVPKKPSCVTGYSDTPYIQVFGDKFGFVKRLSIIDVLLNNGPRTHELLLNSLAVDSR